MVATIYKVLAAHSHCALAAPRVMLLRIWRTGVDPLRWDEYERFEREHSLPMFRQQAGCLGVLFVRIDDSRAAACSFWESQHAIDHLQDSQTYQATVRRLLATGLLTGDQQVEVFSVAGGALDVPQDLQQFQRSNVT